MKNNLDRTPHTMGDWLLLAAGVAAVFAAVGHLPGLLHGAGAFLALLTPFGWGLVLAYVLDIPTRFFAQKLFGGRRGGALAVSYALFFGVLALLAVLIVPQLVQSIAAFAGRLGAYEETIRRLLAWVQETFGIDTATAEQLVQAAGNALQNWFGTLSRTAAQSAAKAAAGAANAAADAFVALAVSIYLLADKDKLLRTARVCLRAALPQSAAGGVLSVCALANRIFGGYLGGQLVDALLVGGETFALMSIFGAGAVPGRGAGAGHPAAGIPVESRRICHHHFCGAAGGRQLYCPAHSGWGHRPARAGRAAGHRGGRRVVRHTGHGAGRADAGGAGRAGPAGCGRGADGPRARRGQRAAAGFSTARQTKLTCYLLQYHFI